MPFFPAVAVAQHLLRVAPDHLAYATDTCSIASHYFSVEVQPFVSAALPFRTHHDVPDAPELSVSFTHPVTGSAGPMTVAVVPSTYGFPDQICEFPQQVRIDSDVAAYPPASPYSAPCWHTATRIEQSPKPWPPRLLQEPQIHLLRLLL